MPTFVAYHRLPSGGDANEAPGRSYQVSFKYFTYATCSLPLLAFCFCIGYSIIYNFERSTATSCRARNVLPSISAAIGGFSPQREVWQVAISLDFVPRMVLIYVYQHYNYSKAGNKLVYIRSILMLIENFALIILTYYDSTHDYTIHRNAFVTFIISSLLHMFLLFCSQRRNDRFEIKLKNHLAMVNFIGIFLAMFFFIVHGIHCPDYIYSLFALCEYIVVLTNIAYHGSIIYDFPNKYLTLSPGDCIRLGDQKRYITMQP
ncbi:post-GPI attachment to proteins factor 2-like [Atheta coriaria]|uniref:post-GPI attachment to proteins factor 2-like n=1 Tax=Dalotia coriaria TaxID=877792 RepID=UPI0031F39BD2